MNGETLESLTFKMEKLLSAAWQDGDRPAYVLQALKYDEERHRLGIKVRKAKSLSEAKEDMKTRLEGLKQRLPDPESLGFDINAGSADNTVWVSNRFYSGPQVIYTDAFLIVYAELVSPPKKRLIADKLS